MCSIQKAQSMDSLGESILYGVGGLGFIFLLGSGFAGLINGWPAWAIATVSLSGATMAAGIGVGGLVRFKASKMNESDPTVSKAQAQLKKLN